MCNRSPSVQRGSVKSVCVITCYLHILAKMLAIGKHMRNLRKISHQSLSRIEGSAVSGVRLHSRYLMHQQAEFNALLGLLERSLPALSHRFGQCRDLHTGIVLCQKNSDDSKKSDGKSDDKPDDKPSQKSEDNKNEKDDKDKDKKKDDENGEQMVSIFTKAVLWIGLSYTVHWIFTTLASLIWPDKSVEDSERSLFVSWQEFVYDMLSSGEVRQIVVKPEFNMVTVYLHDGAVIKGRRSQSRRYHIMLNDSLQFEEKLRDIENRLGIKEREYFVIVVYRRVSCVCCV